MSDVPVHPRIAMRVYQNLLDVVQELPAENRYQLCLMLADKLPSDALAALRAAVEYFQHGGRLRLVLPEYDDGRH